MNVDMIVEKTTAIIHENLQYGCIKEGLNVCLQDNCADCLSRAVEKIIRDNIEEDINFLESH